MSVVKINAIHVREGQGPEIEKRFAGRAHAIDAHIGFESFQLLRPVKGEDRYFVVSTWTSEDDYQTWRAGEGMTNHSGTDRPVATGADLLEFETVEL